MSDSVQIDGEQITREALRPFMIAGGIALRLAFHSIRSARVMAAVMHARHAATQQNQEFAKRYGTSMGFLEVGTEDTEILKGMEARFRQNGIEYSRLPDLQKGDGKTQYLFNMNDLDALNDMLHQYEDEKLGKLADLKSVHVTDEEYQAAKTKLDEEMPAVSIITADEYAKTSVRNGQDTKEFRDLERSAEQELKKTTTHTEQSPDHVVEDLFQSLGKGDSASKVRKTETKTPEQVLGRILPHRRRGR